MSVKKAWGHHLLLNIAGCNDSVRDESAIRAFTRDLVDAIGMVAHGDPLIEHFAEHLPDAAGYSLVQLIETSAVTGHFSDNNRDAYLDIFSCKPFNTDAAIAVAERHFRPASISMLNLSRDAKQPPATPFTKVK